MNFYMDENSITECLLDLASRSQILEQLVEVMEATTSSGLTILNYNADLYSLEFSNTSFSNLLYAHFGDGEYRDLLTRFDIAISRGECIHSEEGRGLQNGPDELMKQGIGGLISTIDKSHLAWWNAQKMCLASTAADFQRTVRFLFQVLKLSANDLENYATLMFPNLHFHAPISNIKRIGLEFNTISADTIKHLAYLNDHATTDFKSNEPHTVIQLAASKGINISPESTNTHANSQAMAERKIKINNTELTCEWHAKLTNSTGRIHFHARPDNYPERISHHTGSKVIIGIITDHLTI